MASITGFAFHQLAGWKPARLTPCGARLTLRQKLDVCVRYSKFGPQFFGNYRYSFSQTGVGVWLKNPVPGPLERETRPPGSQPGERRPMACGFGRIPAMGRHEDWKNETDSEVSGLPMAARSVYVIGRPTISKRKAQQRRQRFSSGENYGRFLMGQPSFNTVASPTRLGWTARAKPDAPR